MARAAEGAASRFALAQRLADASLWEWAPQTGEVRWEPGVLRQFGYTAADFPGTFEAVRARVHPDDRAAWEEDVRACVEDGREHCLEMRVVHPDGQVRWISARGITERGADGAPLRMIGITIDITARKTAEQQLCLTEERFASLMEHSTEGFYLFEPEAPIPTDLPLEEQLDRIYQGRIVDCNPAMARMYGLASPEELIGTPLHALHDTQDPEVRAYMRGVIEGGYRSSGDVSREVNAAGEPVWFSNTFTGVVEDGLLLRVWGTQVDVSETVRAEEAQAELRERLQHMDKLNAIGQLAGGVAHDFNNQLAGILGCAELIGLSLDDVVEVRRCAEEIERLARRSADLTQQLLTFGRREQTTTRSVDLHALLKDVTGILERGIDKRIRLDVELGAESPVIQGDPGQLQSALLNLALNARDAMPSGGDLRIRTRTTRVSDYAPLLDLPPGDYVSIEVADTGTGMSPEVRRRIFEPFFTTKEAGKGTGMGLASTYGAVEAHRGEIQVASQVGRGSRFTVHLPLGDGSRGKRAAPPAAPSPAARVLVVDDEPVVGKVTAALLRSLGQQATRCEDVDEALALYAQEPGAFDLVIVDMQMPKRSGRELLQELRAVDPNFEAIIITGFSEDGEAQRALAEGACAVVPKPYGVAELSAAVAEALGRRSLSP